MSFEFRGDLEISKSWMNRAQIICSYSVNSVQIIGDSQSDDVKLLKKALSDLAEGKKEFYAGLGGTTFRFLVLRVSRENGEFFVRAEKKLLERPQKDLIDILNQLGVKSQLTEDGIHIQSNGWKQPATGLRVMVENSSQFLSAVLLNSINLPFDLEILLAGPITSEGYFKYTVEILRKSGIVLNFDANNSLVRKIIVPGCQNIKMTKMYGELDVSSAFTLIAAGVLAGKVEITNWLIDSLQPDMEFVQIFKSMGISYLNTDSIFKIMGPQEIKSVKVNLQNAPDLFPVLAVLCAFAHGESHLYGAHQLIHKESDRIAKTAELLMRCGFVVTKQPDGLVIQGNPQIKYKQKDLILFDPDHDHRMAFAAALLKLKGFPIMLNTPEVINKSYPQFYQHVGLDMGMVIA